MKNTNSNRTRFFALCIIAALLAICLMTVLVACGDNGDKEETKLYDGKDFNNLADFIDPQLFDSVLCGGLGYIFSNEDKFEDWGFSCHTGESMYGGEMVIVPHSIDFFLWAGSNYDDYFVEIVIWVFESADIAAEWSEFCYSWYDKCLYHYQQDNALILESEKGLLDSIRTSTIPEGAVSSKKLQFIKNAIAKEFSPNCNYSYFFYDASQGFCLESSEVGNCHCTYSVTTDDDTIRYATEEYEGRATSDSYVELVDGEHYIYQRHAPGMHFK